MFKRFGALCIALVLVTQLCVVFAADSFGDDFEWADVPVGTSVVGINGWTKNADATAASNIIDDPNVPGNKCINIVEGASNTKGCAVKNVFEAVDSTSSNGIIDVSFRMCENRDQLYGNYFKIMSGTNVIAILNISYRTPAGKDYYGVDLPYAQYGNTRFTLLRTTTISNSYNANAEGVYPYAVIGPEAAKKSIVWRYFKFRLNFNTSTLDAYYSSAPIAEDATPDCVAFPFITTNSVNSVNTVEIGKGSYRYANTLYDDILIEKPSAAPSNGTFAIDSATANYTVSANDVAVSANVTMPTVGAGEASVIAAAYDATGTLIDVDMDFIASQAQLVGGVIPFTATLTGGANVASVRLFLWDSVAGMTPLSGSVDCTTN